MFGVKRAVLGLGVVLLAGCQSCETPPPSINVEPSQPHSVSRPKRKRAEESRSPASATGDLQVVASTGVEIWLDGTSRGVVKAEEGGVIFQDLPVGDYKLRATMPGYRKIETVVRVDADAIAVVQVRLTRVPESQSGVRGLDLLQEVGEVMLFSAPAEASAAVFLDDVEKGRTPLILTGVSAGPLKIEFVSGEKRLSGVYELRADGLLRLRANFVSERIDELSSAPASSPGTTEPSKRDPLKAQPPKVLETKD